MSTLQYEQYSGCCEQIPCSTGFRINIIRRYLVMHYLLFQPLREITVMGWEKDRPCLPDRIELWWTLSIYLQANKLCLFRCSFQSSSYDTVTYQECDVDNTDGAMSKETGTFTAKVSGIYQFHFQGFHRPTHVSVQVRVSNWLQHN